MIYNVAIVGATGTVGENILKILAERDFPVNNLHLLASSESKGKQIFFKNKEYFVEDLLKFSWKKEKINFAFFCAGSEISSRYAEEVSQTGCIVIDKSSHFRMNNDIPLIIPEVNSDILNKANSKIISSPNCTVIPLLVALRQLNDAFEIKRLVVSTYQSVSGIGKDAMDELYASTRKFFEITSDTAQKNNIENEDDDIINLKNFPAPIAFNCIPHCGEFAENGYTSEELKLVNETRKILNNNEIQISSTSVRVPVFVGHSESVNIEFKNAFELDEIYELLHETEGVLVLDRQKDGGYVTPFEVSGSDAVYVSRVRRDNSIQNGLNLWITCDNLRKGAALNGVQIAEEIVKRGII